MHRPAAYSPEALSFSIQNASAMSILPLPPGLAHSEGETSTASRERRRVALAAKSAVDQLNESLLSRLRCLEDKLDLVLAGLPSDGEVRLTRLETITLCCNPTVDDVLDDMFRRSKSVSCQPAEELSPERAAVKQIGYNTSEERIRPPLVESLPKFYDMCGTVSKATQTDQLPKLRKSRCHGRASQTESTATVPMMTCECLPVDYCCTSSCRQTGVFLQLSPAEAPADDAGTHIPENDFGLDDDRLSRDPLQVKDPWLGCSIPRDSWDAPDLARSSLLWSRWVPSERSFSVDGATSREDEVSQSTLDQSDGFEASITSQSCSDHVDIVTSERGDHATISNVVQDKSGREFEGEKSFKEGEYRKNTDALIDSTIEAAVRRSEVRMEAFCERMRNEFLLNS